MKLLCDRSTQLLPAPALARSDERAAPRGRDAVAFVGLMAYTVLLFIRPNELYPEIFGTLPIVKVLAIITILFYLGARALRNDAITVWPLEALMVLVMIGIGFLLVPLSASPQDSVAVLSESYVKVAIIFFLMINVVTTRERLRWVFKAVVVCGAWLAICAVRYYAAGLYHLDSDVTRVFLLVGGMFGNPNDLAIVLTALLPLAVALAMTSSGTVRVFYFSCAAALGAGVVITFSRTGFLGLMATGAFLVWKLGRNHRATTLLAVALVLGAFLAASPGGYADRLSTIVETQNDPTGSAQERTALLKRAISVAATHPVVGVGIGNYHIYSIQEKVAHNAYLETSAELGLVGLAAYLTLLLAPLLSLRRVERDTSGDSGGARASDSRSPEEREYYYISVALQASFLSYIVCSFFASIQYQWLVYYLVALAVSLRTLYAGRDVSAAVGPFAAAVRGVLWKSYQRRGTGPVETPDLDGLFQERLNS